MLRPQVAAAHKTNNLFMMVLQVRNCLDWVSHIGMTGRFCFGSLTKVVNKSKSLKRRCVFSQWVLNMAQTPLYLNEQKTPSTVCWQTQPPGLRAL
jgi:hypothetical protein